MSIVCVLSSATSSSSSSSTQDVLALLDLVALDPILLLDRLVGLGVDDLVADAVAGLAVDDVEANALAGGGGGVERDRAGDQREFQIALPIRTRRHDITPTRDSD